MHRIKKENKYFDIKTICQYNLSYNIVYCRMINYLINCSFSCDKKYI